MTLLPMSSYLSKLVRARIGCGFPKIVDFVFINLAGILPPEPR